MINKERVHEEFKLAYMDQRYEKDLEKIGSYYKSDYVGKELMISFITGTLCYGICLLLWVLAQTRGLAEQVNSLDYLGLGISMAVSYLLFILSYMFVTAMIYTLRYNRMHKMALAYLARLRKLHKLYEREEERSERAKEEEDIK